MTTPENIVQAEKAQLDFSRSMSYGDYLHLDQILSAQHPLSPRMMRCCLSFSIRPVNCG